MPRHSFVRALVAVLLTSGTLLAQPPGGPPPPPRDSLEAMVRQRMAQVVRTQLGLNDDQMRRLQTTNRRYERQRIALVEQEREVRLGLRDEIESGDTTRSAQVAALLDRMMAIQRQRLALLEEEQKELATFLTPVQRARYFGMEAQIRRRVMEMREQGMRRGTDGGRRPIGAPPTRGVRRPPG